MIPCPHCGKWQTSRYAANQHIKSAHPDLELIPLNRPWKSHKKQKLNSDGTPAPATKKKVFVPQPPPEFSFAPRPSPGPTSSPSASATVHASHHNGNSSPSSGLHSATTPHSYSVPDDSGDAASTSNDVVAPPDVINMLSGVVGSTQPQNHNGKRSKQHHVEDDYEVLDDGSDDYVAEGEHGEVVPVEFTPRFKEEDSWPGRWDMFEDLVEEGKIQEEDAKVLRPLFLHEDKRLELAFVTYKVKHPSQRKPERLVTMLQTIVKMTKAST
ncbi:hypothetical protein HK102_013035 [Quaeritorhiza haematococci]|nr:hypothetical protein HK102_013035 [Quaeritorhiza haematococci]